MNVLVCGSRGCVGRAVVRTLRWRGHRVVEAARGLYEGDSTLRLDFMQPRTASEWAARLRARRIDAVVNCVGILMPSAKSSFERIHSAGPIELFRGAAEAGVRRVVQVSALGVATSDAHETVYLRSKRLADESLDALGLDAAVVRPSLIFGPGSESARLFATLASLPIVSLPGRGDQQVQPIHVFEVAEAIAALVERSGSARGVYELGGPRPISYRHMLQTYRDAHGFGEAIWVRVPPALMHLGARLAERLPQRVFSRDTLVLLERGNVVRRNAATVLLGRAPSSLAEGLQVTRPEPAFAMRVELPGPVALGVRFSLAFLWLYTAAISAFLPERSGVLDLLARCGFTGDAGYAALAASCVLNVGLGVSMLIRPSARLYALQCAAVVGYTAAAALGAPELTLDHCGPLVKNLTVLACVVVSWLAQASQPRLAAALPASTGAAGASPSPAIRSVLARSIFGTVKTRSA